jgi:hypothetical protein
MSIFVYHSVPTPERGTLQATMSHFLLRGGREGKREVGMCLQREGAHSGGRRGRLREPKTCHVISLVKQYAHDAHTHTEDKTYFQDT